MSKGFFKKLAVFILACTAMMMAACGGGKTEPETKPLDPGALVQTIGALKDGQGAALFDSPAQPDSTELSDIYNIDVSLLQEYLIVVDKKYNFCMMMVPAEGKSNDVKNMMSTAMTQLAQQLELYEPDQCERVRSHLETMRGDYLIYAASGDNDALVKEIEKALG